jgi:FlaA1/EpsC-like NDP-sugar epimerase
MEMRRLYWTLANRVPVRFLILGLVYAGCAVCGLWLCRRLLTDFAAVSAGWSMGWGAVSGAVVLKLGLLYGFGQFEDSLSYFSTPDLRRVLGVCAAFTGFLLAGRLLSLGPVFPPVGLCLMEGVVSCAWLCGARLGIRFFRERYLTPQNRPAVRARRVGIVGAGDTGTALARELLAKGWLGLRPAAFFDDHRRRGTRVHGIAVLGAPEALLEPGVAGRLDEVVLALPTVSGVRMRQVVDMVRRSGLPFRTIPSMTQMALGRVSLSQIRPVQIEDLLGRDQVEVGTENVRQMISGASVLVTGAGGSIGGELCRQILRFGPRRMLILDRSEAALFPVEQELRGAGGSGLVEPLVADLLDERRLEAVVGGCRPELVFHAAAHKHVPMMESQPGEAIRNNVLGTSALARMAVKSGVVRFVFVSTDKAVNPTNVMGATKRLAECMVQAIQTSVVGGTRFAVVRFGNVLGSSGSVVPTFARQIAAGGPVTVTHPEVTRYFMTIPEAVSLILQSASRAEGGETFVLDMGQPVRIADLARQMVELSGLRPGEDVQIVFTGLRPGEKLYEELSQGDEEVETTDHPKIFRMKVFGSRVWPGISEGINGVQELEKMLGAAVRGVAQEELKRLLARLVPEYRPGKGGAGGMAGENGVFSGPDNSVAKDAGISAVQREVGSSEPVPG